MTKDCFLRILMGKERGIFPYFLDSKHDLGIVNRMICSRNQKLQLYQSHCQLGHIDPVAGARSYSCISLTINWATLTLY